MHEKGSTMSNDKPKCKPLYGKEQCCELISTSSHLARYVAANVRPCRAEAKWQVGSKFYCTRHAKQRGILPQ